MKSAIEQVLAGNVEIDVFLRELKLNEDMQAYISDFVPEAAKKDQSHSFWKVVPYETMRKNNFNYYQFLFWGLRSNDKFGNHLSVFSRLQRAYQYYYPDFECTSRYSDVFNMYLDVVQDCFDGPEVRSLVEHVIDEALHYRFMNQRKKHAQTAIKELFHLECKKRPRWVHGPEWPMGKNTPMVFISQKKSGDKVQFVFCDVDTKEFRTIEQFY